MNRRVTLAINSVAALLLGWLYGGDTLDALRSRTAEVSAFLEPPSLGFAAVALAATVLGFGATVLGVVQKRDGGWRGYRLMPIVVVVVLFVDLFVLGASKSPLGTADRTALTLKSFADAACAASPPDRVLTDVAQLQPMVEQFGAPAYLLKGVPARAWTVVVRPNCTGPVSEAKGEPLGTVFYCVAEGARRAWVTVVALPVGSFFGAPQVFSRGGEVVVGDVVPPAPEEPPPPDEPGADRPPEEPDSGR